MHALLGSTKLIRLALIVATLVATACAEAQLAGGSSGLPPGCADTSGSGTAQTCNTASLFPMQVGQGIVYQTSTANTGDLTINVNFLGAIHVRKWLGSATLSAGDLPANVPVPLWYDGTYWETLTIGNAPAGGSGLPSGMIAMVDSTLGSCPSGWTEVSQAGNYLLLTVAANSDAGTSGGSNSYTPAGTNSTPTFTGTAGTIPAETFTGTSNQTTSAVSAGTPAGTNSGGSFTDGAISWPAGVPTNASGSFTEGALSWPASVPTQAADTFGTTKFTTSGSGTAAFTSETARGAISWPASVPTIAAGTFTQPTISWPAGVPTIAAGTFTQPAFNGSALATHSHTITPSGTNGTASFTPAGTVSTPGFTGTLATLQPTYYKVIPCKKN